MNPHDKLDFHSSTIPASKEISGRMNECLLSIAIPTWNRANYLAQNLEQLRVQLADVSNKSIELLVSDNSSSDNTPRIVRNAIAAGMAIKYVQNKENIGWGRNFFQCFDLARGRYVLILGDDDLLIDGALKVLVNHLSGQEYGAICLRTYGYDHDFRAEHPGIYGGERVYENPQEFLVAIGPLATMISACVLNKRLMRGIDTRTLYCGDLAHLHLVLWAALKGRKNLFIKRPMVACKRNNSANYKFSKIFVEEYWKIMDDYIPMGLSRSAIRSIESNLLFSYYPYYLLQERLADSGDHALSQTHFAARFGDRWLYRCWAGPILLWPRPVAIYWGVITTAIGRVMGGELRRGIYFAKNWLMRKIAR